MILRPSASGIWTKCSLMPRLAATVPEEPASEPAMEGTCAAWLADVTIKSGGQCADMLGQQCPDNGWVVTPDMVHYIQGYVDMIRGYGGRIDTERKVRLNAHIEGTPDAFAVLDDGTLRVDDLKYGFDPVEPWTPQIAIYAGALVRYMSARGTSVRRVILGIYQPRAYHHAGIHRTMTMWPEDLMARVRDIESAGERCLGDNPVAIPGHHCEYCPAAGKCTAVAHEVYRLTHRMYAGQTRPMTAQEMSTELSTLALAEDLLKGRKRAVHAEAEARMGRGEHIPGWTRKHGKGQRKWTADATTVHVMTGVDPTSGKMVTPAELERRGADPEVVKLMTETPDTKAKLQPVRPEDMARAFGEL